MSRRLATGLYDQRPRSRVVQDLVQRARAHLAGMAPGDLDALLEDALYQERLRVDRHGGTPEERARLDALAKALVRGTSAERLDTALLLVAAWADEIHGRFSMPAYRFASRVFPTALAGLLSGAPRGLSGWSLDAADQVRIEGDLPFLRELKDEATLILTPTHISNLDSPLIGFALLLAGLPPFQYGAGLNLFDNPLLGWWMQRLGAYTVDRRKRAALYKHVLKDYSVLQLTRRHHSLFFPGGTRSRSGAVETHVKKGLLGTGVLAWQEMLAAGRPDPDVYVVPLTLSFALTLEANTLIQDFLEDAGRQRYIITDDEFAEPRTVIRFVQRILSLDNAVVCRFGDPVDVLGRPVPRDREARAAASTRRRLHVSDRDGVVQRDPQRDRVYTEMLADALVEAWPKGTTVMATHLAAWTAWRLLEQDLDTRDPFRIVRAPVERRAIGRVAYLAALGADLAAVRDGAAAGRWHANLPDHPEEVLVAALQTFRAYHRSAVLKPTGSGDRLLVEDPRLCLYYRNRLTHAELSP